jgi:hypothetical protein
MKLRRGHIFGKASTFLENFHAVRRDGLQSSHCARELFEQSYEIPALVLKCTAMRGLIACRLCFQENSLTYWRI